MNKVLIDGSVNWPCIRRRNYPQKPVMKTLAIGSHITIMLLLFSYIISFRSLCNVSKQSQYFILRSHIMIIQFVLGYIILFRRLSTKETNTNPNFILIMTGFQDALGLNCFCVHVGGEPESEN